jgi:hypothetical protein
MVCKYCGGAATTKYSVCGECRELIRYYKSIAGSTKGNYTVYSRVRLARIEYQLLTLPNPPINLIKLHNNGMWPMSMEYVKCAKCGKNDLIGRCGSHNCEIYCAECTEALMLP